MTFKLICDNCGNEGTNEDNSFSMYNDFIYSNTNFESNMVIIIECNHCKQKEIIRLP